MKTFIRENTWLTRGSATIVLDIGCDFGWGNGYTLIPEGNPLHGKHYDDIDVCVHGGLTFSELVTEEMAVKWGLDVFEDVGMWCFGFDTAHSGDSLSSWTKEAVQIEADLLTCKLDDLAKEMV